MSSSRFSGLNIILLVLTAASLMFGVYGLIAGGSDDSGRPGNRVEAAELNPGFDHDGSSADAPLSGELRPDTSGNSKPVKPKDSGSSNQDTGTVVNKDPGVPEIAAVSKPSDHGDAAIQGSVIGADGSAITDATVTARRSDLDLQPPEFSDGDIEGYRRDVTKFLQKTAQESRTTTTDQDGNFRFAGLDPTLAYDISAQSETRGSGEQERVAAGDTIVLLLSATGMLVGRVETADGKPITSFGVKIWRENRQWEATSRRFEDEQGKFSMPAKNGAMQVEVTATGFTQGEPAKVEIAAGMDEIVFVLEQAAILTGVVTDKDGNALGEVEVRVGGDNGNNNRNRWNNQPSGPRVRTDSKGRYRFDTLPPKETKFTAELGEMSESQTITLVQGDNTLDFSMDVGAVVKLRLSDPQGQAIEADNVWFQQKGGRNWPRPERMPAKEPGLAEYAGLQPGEYTMTVTAPGFPVIRQDIEVVVGANEYKLSFTNGALLTGKVTSSSGSKVSNVSVRLRKEGEQGWGGWGGGTYAQVQEDGSYKLGPAEPGQWNIEVYATGGSWTQVYTDIITLAEGENQHSITVDAGATVVVKMLDQDGNALSWGNVQLQAEQGGKNFSGSSDSEGVVTISFVQVGSYSLVANARGMAAPSQFVSLRAGDNSFTVRMQKPNACRLTYIYPDTQASKIGLQVGDLVTEYNAQTVSSWGELGRLIRQTKSSDDVVIVVDRGGTLLTFNIKGSTLGIEGQDGVR